MSVVTGHIAYFCNFACSEIFQENARELGVSRVQFYAGVNGLKYYQGYKEIIHGLYSSDITPKTAISTRGHNFF